MTVQQLPPNRYLERPSPSSLADVIDTILDKGLVIDAYIRVSLVGIELLTIDARIVVASVDTYLRFAEAVNRLDLTQTETSGLPELMEEVTQGGAKKKTSGAIEGAKEKFSEIFGGDEDDDQEGEEEDEDQGSQRQTQRASSRGRSSRTRKSTSSRSKG